MSRSLSLARISFEQANVALEDVILAELREGALSCDAMVNHLNHSLVHLNDLGCHIGALSRKMDSNHFVDLPSLHTIDLDALGVRLVDSGMVEDVSWQEVVGAARCGGFRSVLSIILGRVRDLDHRTRTLINLATTLDLAAIDGRLHDVLEENQHGNIKVAFAQLYNEWASFQQFFLASSMASTEQWYIFMGYGSLVGQPVLISGSTSDQRPSLVSVV